LKGEKMEKSTCDFVGLYIYIYILGFSIWVCLKIGYTPILAICGICGRENDDNPMGFRGTRFSDQTHFLNSG